MAVYRVSSNVSSHTLIHDEISTVRRTFWPMFVIATATAIVASQAMISATFQIVKQALAQNFFPRFKVKHTNRKHEGQIYIPVRTQSTNSGIKPQHLLIFVVCQLLVTSVAHDRVHSVAVPLRLVSCCLMSSLRFMFRAGIILPSCCHMQVMNWTLMTLCIIVVATFQTSTKLGRAYGARRFPHLQLPCA